MKEMESKQTDEMKVAILQKLELLAKNTTNVSSLIDASEKSSIISKLEKDTILQQFKKAEDQAKVLYLILNAKACPGTELLNLLNSSGNQKAAGIFEEKKISTGERDQWPRLQKMITDNIDRMSSHTMHLGLVLCFASGIGLISGRDREIIANYSELEIDQLKKFYLTVSEKEDDAYEKLIKVLKMTNNNWALDVLKITD